MKHYGVRNKVLSNLCRARKRLWVADMALRHGWFRVLIHLAALAKSRREPLFYLGGVYREVIQYLQSFYDRIRSIFRRWR